MNILEELKLSKKQNNNKRYDYLSQQFNVVNYAIKLEKYTIKLQQKNQKYKEVIDELNDLLIIKKARCLNEDNYILNVPDLDDILQVLKEVE